MTFAFSFDRPALTEDEARRFRLAIALASLPPRFVPGVKIEGATGIRKVPYPLTVIDVPIGKGKTHDLEKALEAVPDLHAGAFVPTIELGQQFKSKLETSRIADDVLGGPSEGARTVGLWLGLEQPDPQEKRLNPKAPPICDELDLTSFIRSCASDPRSVCVRDGAECRKASKCRINLQALPQNEPDILIAAHAFAAHPVKNWHQRDVAVYDEDAAASWFVVEDFGVSLLDVGLQEQHKPAWFDVEDLAATITQLRRLVVRAANGCEVPIVDFPRYDLVKALHKTWWRAQKREKGEPNPTPAYTKAFKDANKGEPKLAKAVQFLERLLQRMAETDRTTGRVPGLRGKMITTPIGEEAALEVGFVNVPHELYHAPSFLLSGTPRIEAYGRIFDRVEVVRIEPEQPPNQKVIRVPEKGTMTQILDRGLLDKLVDLIRHLHRGVYNTASGPYDTLVVAKEEVEDRLKEKLEDLDRVAFAHFGALQGRNDFAAVRLEFVVGVRLPKPIEVQVLAETIAGVPIDIGDPTFWPKRAFTETPRAGGGPRVMHDYTHRHPVMRSVLNSILHAEIIQADRMRARRRPEDDLTLVLVNELDLSSYGVVVDEHLILKENRNWYQVLAERGVVPDLDHPKSGHGINALIFSALPDMFKKGIKQVANVRASGSAPTGDHGFPSPQTMWVWPKGARGREPVLVNAPSRAAAAELLRELYPDAREIKARNRKRGGARRATG